MPMPHRTHMQLIKRRLIGKEGSERVHELRVILQELPGYRNGRMQIYGGGSSRKLQRRTSALMQNNEIPLPFVVKA